MSLVEKYLGEAKGISYICDKCSKKFNKKVKRCPECGSKEISTMMDIFHKMK